MTTTDRLPLVGYTDRLSVAPRGTIRFMVSCEQDTYQARLVRLFHGDRNPAGPGLRQVEIPSPIDGQRRGKREKLQSGSSALLPLDGEPFETGMTFVCFVQPWLPGAGRQVVASLGEEGSGWEIALDHEAVPELSFGALADRRSVRAARPLERWEWSHLAVVLDFSARSALLHVCSVGRCVASAGRPEVATGAFAGRPSTRGPLVLAAARLRDGSGAGYFDGRIDRPRLWSRPLATGELDRAAGAPDDLALVPGLVGAWDFQLELHGDQIVDSSGAGRHGRLLNLPTRAVAGHNFSGRETTFRLAPEEYGAVHFHRDDLEDAGWGVDFELTVPDDLPSGVYAAWLRAGASEDYLPFVVGPAPDRPGPPVAVLLSTLTYLAYANFTDLGPNVWQGGAFVGNALTHPFANPAGERAAYRYIDEHALYGPYDRHLDGSGICYSSLRRPILNLRPTFRYRTLDAPARWPADLYLIDWLDRCGIEVDVLTDHDLHAEGRQLLDRYRVVLSSSHHEYWTSAMLDALEGYLKGGGRFMYLGGNGLYGVASLDSKRPHLLEIRRWGTSWPFECPPAERYHSTTGEPGGTWRNRGRPPNQLVGVGTAGAGFDRGSPYARLGDAADSRVGFVFEGLSADELIGDVPSLQLRWGAAGYEFDRVEAELGSPPHTLRLASSVRFNQSHRSLIDDQLWFTGGRDGEQVDAPQLPGRPHRFARSDLAYLEYPNGGAVFAAGAISWTSCLSANGYENNVSRVTENVLRRFAETPAGCRPEDGAPGQAASTGSPTPLS